MKYGFLNNKLVLVKYVVKYDETFDDETITMEEDVITDEHLENIKARFDKQSIKYTVETVDNSSIEWILDIDFTDEEIANGLVEKAVEMGEEDFTDYLYETDENAQRDEALLYILNSIYDNPNNDLFDKTLNRLSNNRSVSNKKINSINLMVNIEGDGSCEV